MKYEISNQETQKGCDILPVNIPTAPLPKETTIYIAFYFILRAESPGAGLIQNYQNQTQYLADKFGIAEDLFSSYLAEIEKIKLTAKEGNNIRLVGWKKFRFLFGIKTNERSTIIFFPGKDKFQNWVEKNFEHSFSS